MIALVLKGISCLHWPGKFCARPTNLSSRSPFGGGGGGGGVCFLLPCDRGFIEQQI